MPRPALITPDILKAALTGLELQRSRIEEKIAQLKSMLQPKHLIPTIPTRRRRKGRMSAEGRKRIAEAQRKRWAKLKRRS